jgi:hypothetical protein
MDGLARKLETFGYRRLEEDWRNAAREEGPGVVEYKTWITTAVTYSRPRRGPDGRNDYTLPFEISAELDQITPTGCASPLLWMTAKVMRWNVTLFRDLTSFFVGSSPDVRRRIAAIEELERVAFEEAAAGWSEG